MRTIGVSCETKDWIASTRLTFGLRSTISTSTRVILLMTETPARAAPTPSPSPQWGGEQCSKLRASNAHVVRKLPSAGETAPPSPLRGGVGGGGQEHSAK